MTEPAKTELERCLATLDLYANGADAYCQVSQEAARLLRALAADFEHATNGNYSETWAILARAKWRLP